MNLFLVSFSLYFLGTLLSPAQAAIPSLNSCHYYLDKEKETGCWFKEKNSSNYLVKYGYKYCSIFKNRSLKWQDARSQWVKKATLCLQSDLEGFRQLSNCKKLESRAFDSHPRCYVKSGFCDLNFNQKISIVWTAIGVDVLLKPTRSFYQAFKLTNNCMNALTYESDEIHTILTMMNFSESDSETLLEVLDVDTMDEFALRIYANKLLSTLLTMKQNLGINPTNTSLKNLIDYKASLLEKR